MTGVKKGKQKREVGIVRWYDEEEGYGYIARRNGGDVYVHYSAILCRGAAYSLREGDPVEFTVVDDGEGETAQAREVVPKK